MRRALGLAVVALMMFTPLVSGLSTRPPEPVPDLAFRAVDVTALLVIPEPSFPPEAPPAIILEPHRAPSPPVRPSVPVPAPVARTVARPGAAATGGGTGAFVGGKGSLVGKASWYCSVAQPICHYKYPPGSMVAAACGKLRRAMGPKWRGQYVSVKNLANGKTETVQLVDWCGSETKTIDLYWAPMAKLGGTGVLNVRVSW